jgi:hypothetical protein
MDGGDGLQLGLPQHSPPQRVDDVVLQRRVEFFEFAHKSISSTDAALAAARSMADISVSASVSV